MATLAAVRLGTTSACAENTHISSSVAENYRNYLRVRGEYKAKGTPARVTVERPPRARRIQIKGLGMGTMAGTTSACAENTG